jgi:hypothetical protein
MTCKNCGGSMVGDGYTLVRHCENVNDIQDKEPDAGPIYCELKDYPEYAAPMSLLHWEATIPSDNDTLWTAKLLYGDRLTVLLRKTGFTESPFDVETGYRSAEDKFWLASGRKDVRMQEGLTIQEAIDWVKANANTCKGE